MDGMECRCPGCDEVSCEMCAGAWGPAPLRTPRQTACPLGSSLPPSYHTDDRCAIPPAQDNAFRLGRPPSLPASRSPRLEDELGIGHGRLLCGGDLDAQACLRHVDREVIFLLEGGHEDSQNRAQNHSRRSMMRGVRQVQRTFGGALDLILVMETAQGATSIQPPATQCAPRGGPGLQAHQSLRFPPTGTHYPCAGLQGRGASLNHPGAALFARTGHLRYHCSCLMLAVM